MDDVGSLDVRSHSGGLNGPSRSAPGTEGSGSETASADESADEKEYGTAPAARTSAATQRGQGATRTQEQTKGEKPEPLKRPVSSLAIYIIHNIHNILSSVVTHITI